MIRIKVCGMRDVDNLEGLSGLQPDFVGLIFYPKSPRYLGVPVDRRLFSILHRFSSRVGVFVKEPVVNMLQLAERYKLNYLQLHGGESVEVCKKLKKSGAGVIKVFSVLDELPVKSLEEYSPYVDYFMFDTKTSGYGGSGQHFDWSILKNYQCSVPYFLSGGISEADIDGIVRQDLPGLFAIDLNSRIEIEPGIKDLESVRRITTNLKKVIN